MAMYTKQQHIIWEEKTPAPVACYGHSAVRLGNQIYLGGGYDFIGPKLERNVSFGIHSYDMFNNSWDPPIKTPYCWFAMTIFKNNLLIVGGKDEGREVTDKIFKVFKMNANDDQLELYTRMKMARCKATAIGYNGMLIIVGGQDNNKAALSSTELFDSKNDEWYTCSKLPSPHYSINAAIVKNNLYLLGGVDQINKSSTKGFVASLDALPGHNLSWYTLSDTPYFCSTPVCVNDTHLLVLGGSSEYHHDYTSDTYRLDQCSNTWVKIGCLPFARNLMAAVNVDDGIIVIGGTKDKGVPMNTMWKGSCNHAQ